MRGMYRELMICCVGMRAYAVFTQRFRSAAEVVLNSFARS